MKNPGSACCNVLPS